MTASDINKYVYYKYYTNKIMMLMLTWMYKRYWYERVKKYMVFKNKMSIICCDFVAEKNLF